MKILVTGGAGFIASHVVDKYIELGHEVQVVDDLSGGFEKNINPKAKFHKIDIRTPEFEEIIKSEKYDIINHHAAQASVSVSVKKPILDAESNIIASLRMIHASLESGVKKIIYANTGGALFGEPDSLPVTEMTQIRPESPYGVSKFTAERYLHAYSKLEGLNYTSLRYSNVFGPRQNPHGEAGVVAIFAQKIIDGEKCIIFGDGTKTRDYIYIDDVVDANIKALEKGDNDVFLIGTGEQVKDIEMYNAVKESLGSMEEPEFGEFRKGDIVHMQFDCSKAQKELEWKPKVSFREGVTKTIEWFTRKEV